MAEYIYKDAIPLLKYEVNGGVISANDQADIVVDGLTWSIKNYDTTQFLKSDGFDKDPNTFVRSSVSGAVGDAIGVIFPYPIRAGRMSIQVTGSSSTSMLTYDIEGLLEDGTWEVLYSGALPAAPTTEFGTFEPKVITAVRVRCLTRGGSGSWGFQEFTLFEAIDEPKSLIFNDGEYKYWNGEQPGPSVIFPPAPFTSDNDVLGTVTASMFRTNNDPYKALDDNVASSSFWYAQSVLPNDEKHWWQLETKESKIITSLTVQSAVQSGSTGTLTAFKFYASQDGVVYDQLLDVAFPPQAAAKVTYDIVATKPYKFFKIGDMVGASGTIATTGLRNVEFMFATPPTNSGEWVNLGATFPTKQQFEQFGMQDLLNKLSIYGSSDSALSLLTGAIKVVSMVPANPNNSLQLDVSGEFVSLDRVAEEVTDVSLLGVNEITDLELIGVGETRIAMSFNKGLNYYTYRNGMWTEEPPENSMTNDEMEQLTNEIINLIRGESQTLRFRYYLADNSKIDSMTMVVSMLGVETIADTSKYGVSYDKVTKKITVTFNANGTFAVNYLDTI